jgi:hypothetical protein
MTVPPLAEWLRWIAEMPPSFRAAPDGEPGGRVRVRAVVSDLLETLHGATADPVVLAAFDVAPGAARSERNRLGWVLAACHVFWHPAVRAAPLSRRSVQAFLVQELAQLGAVASIDLLDRDEERREELVRRVLRAIRLSLPGESPHEAEDRLQQVDSVERHRVLGAAAKREKRSREVREAMARKAAEEAAAKVSRE